MFFFIYFGGEAVFTNVTSRRRREMNSQALFHPWPPSTTSCPPPKEPGKWPARFYGNRRQTPLERQMLQFHYPVTGCNASVLWTFSSLITHNFKQTTANKINTARRKTPWSNWLNPLLCINDEKRREMMKFDCCNLSATESNEVCCQTLQLVGDWINC